MSSIQYPTCSSDFGDITYNRKILGIKPVTRLPIFCLRSRKRLLLWMDASHRKDYSRATECSATNDCFVCYLWCFFLLICLCASSNYFLQLPKQQPPTTAAVCIVLVHCCSGGHQSCSLSLLPCVFFVLILTCANGGVNSSVGLCFFPWPSAEMTATKKNAHTYKTFLAHFRFFLLPQRASHKNDLQDGNCFILVFFCGPVAVGLSEGKYDISVTSGEGS